MLRKYLLFSVIMLITNGIVFSNDKLDEIYHKNTITADVLFIFPAFITMSEDDEEEFNLVAAAIQYERQISKTFSVAGRLGYRGFYDNEDDLSMSAFSFEANFRGYPAGNIFFLGGMLGYTYLYFDKKNKSTEAHFFVVGSKIGWRIDFNQSKGFILEPSLGYYIPFGKTNLKRTDDLLVKLFFAGGLQVSLNLGYRF